MDRKIILLVIFIFAKSIFAESPQYSETVLSPPLGHSSLIPLLGSQQAPSSHSTEGPGGRPNLELVPLTTGSINSLSPSMMKGPARAQIKASEEEAELSRKLSKPLPKKNPIKSNQNPQ